MTVMMMMMITSAGWVTLRLNFGLNGYFRANIYEPLSLGNDVLQLCRWKFSHKLCSKLYWIKVDFYSKKTRFL